MKKLIITFILLATSCFAETYSMRDCMLLPITDNAGSSFGFKVFEEVEKYLKDKRWCEYKSSSEVISIFSRYRDQLDAYLDDPNVIKTVADRLKVGTIIKVKLKYEVDKVEVKLDIFGENGSDIYFSEKMIVDKIELYPVKIAIENWLNLYEANIPYDGKVLGVLGDQITFSVPRNKRVGISQEIKVRKFIRKKEHPLLKKVVEFEALPVAKGKIFNLSRGQAIGSVKVFTAETQVRVGDWVILGEYNPEVVSKGNDYSKYNEMNFGQLGELQFGFSLSSHTATTDSYNGNNKMNGYMYGVHAQTEVWITRNYIVLGEFNKRFGELSKRSGSPDSNTVGQDMTALKLAFGYKYLPMGYFYGPQINFYGGYANYSYKLDQSSLDGFGANEFTGIMLGVGGNIPVQKGIRIFGRGEIIPFGDFEDTDNIFGSNKSISSMLFEIGGVYQWSPTLKLLGSFEVSNNSAKFNGSNSEVSYANTSLKVGGAFNF